MKLAREEQARIEMEEELAKQQEGTVPVKIDATNFEVSITPCVVVRFLSSKRFSKALFFYFEELYVTTR